MTRGIFATAYASLAKQLSEVEAVRLYAETYKDEPFIRVLHDTLPQTKATVGPISATLL